MSQESKYISLLSDFGFKRIFKNEQHPEFLIDFIESTIPTLSIKQIFFKDTEHTRHNIDGSAIFDVYCELVLCQDENVA